MRYWKSCERRIFQSGTKNHGKRGEGLKTRVSLFVILFPMRKSLLLLCFCLVSLTPLFGQVILNKDSLLQLVSQAKEDTLAVQLYISLGQQYENNEPELAKTYYRQARELSRKLHYPKGIIKAINNYTYVLNM